MRFPAFMVVKGLGCIQFLSGGIAALGGISLMSGVITTTNDGTGLGSMLVFLGFTGIIAGTIMLITGLGLLRDRRWARRANIVLGVLLGGCAGTDGIANGWRGGNLALVLVGFLLAAVMLIPAVKDRCAF